MGDWLYDRFEVLQAEAAGVEGGDQSHTERTICHHMIAWRERVSARRHYAASPKMIICSRSGNEQKSRHGTLAALYAKSTKPGRRAAVPASGVNCLCNVILARMRLACVTRPRWATAGCD